MTVTSAAHPNTTMLQVPRLNTYNDFQWTDAVNLSLVPAFFHGASSLSQVVWAAAAEGQILSIPADFLNETYHVDFIGPAAKCMTATNQSLISEIRAVEVPLAYEKGMEITYFSWVAGDDAYTLNNSTNNIAPQTLDMSSTDVNRLYIVPYGGGPDTDVWTAMECQFYNATYSVDFAYSNGKQEVTIQNVTYLDPLCWHVYYGEAYDVWSGGASTDRLQITMRTVQMRAYFGLVERFGSLFVGSEMLGWSAHLEGNQSSFTSKDMLHIDFNASISEIQSKVEELFQNLTVSLLSHRDFW